MNEDESFRNEVAANLRALGADAALHDVAQDFLLRAVGHRYAYNFSWMGRPIIQIPQDIYAVQELIWQIRPDVVIETGVAHGGSLILSASLLAMLDYADAAQRGGVLDPKRSTRKVVGVDIEIRPHNRRAIEAHPMAHLIQLVEGSSTAPEVVAQVRAAARGKKTLVMLDSNHTHAHVLDELRAYGPLVSEGSYCVVWDTGVEHLPPGFVTNRPWGPGDNPLTAARAYLREIAEHAVLDADGNRVAFEVDQSMDHKLLVSAGPEGFLRRVPGLGTG